MRKKRTSFFTGSVWFCTFLLIVLAVITATIAGICLRTFAHRENVTISLFAKTRPMTVGRQSLNVNTKTVMDQGIVTVLDDKKFWGVDTNIEIFQSSYQNAEGTVTVQSENMKKVIAPGTEGSYTFTVKNEGKKAADFKMWMENENECGFFKVPFQMRVFGNNKWMLGGEQEWKNAKELDSISVTECIAAGKSINYTLYWKWPFEQSLTDDAADTQMGNVAVSRDLSYKVKIHIRAAQSEERKEAVKTGDETRVRMWTILLIISAAVLCVLRKTE